MGRSSPDPVTNPLELITRFARYYKHGPRNQYDHLFFFSKYKHECESLLIFGGRVYKQYGGWCWFCGARKQLTALCKLLEPDSDWLRPELQEFVARMQNENMKVYNK